MSRKWSIDGDDSSQLPHGMVRIGYDADTQTYTYRDSDGSYWEGPQGSRYGRLTMVSKAPRCQAPNGRRRVVSAPPASLPPYYSPPQSQIRACYPYDSLGDDRLNNVNNIDDVGPWHGPIRQSPPTTFDEIFARGSAKNDPEIQPLPEEAPKKEKKLGRRKRMSLPAVFRLARHFQASRSSRTPDPNPPQPRRHTLTAVETHTAVSRSSNG